MNPKTIISLLAIAPVLVWRAEAQQSDTNFFSHLVCSNRTYTNATIKCDTPTFVFVDWDGGGERIPFTNLPPEIQTRYYDPQEMEKYLAQQAADDVAKSTLGPAQEIRILNVVWENRVQIEAEGKVTTAYVHNLPPPIVALLIDLNQTKLRVAEFERRRAKDQYAVAHPPIPPTDVAHNYAELPYVTLGSNLYLAALTAWRATVDAVPDHEAELDQVTSHLNELQAVFKSHCTIIARPTGFMVSKAVRQWEYQGMPAVTLAPTTPISMQTNTSISNNEGQSNSPPPTTPSSSGTVVIEGDDFSLDVFADGSFVGNVPAKINLSEGNHVIEVKKAGFKDYNREIKVTAGSELKLHPVLEKH